MTNLLNRVKETTATTGTGTVTLSGTRVSPYQTWVNGGALNGVQYDYLIEDGSDSEWGLGTFTLSGTTLSRDTVVGSTIGGTSGTTKINLSGSATVACAALEKSYHPFEAVAGSVIPLAANFTHVNFAGATTITDYGNGVQLHVPTGANSVNMGAIATPAAPFSVYMRGRAVMPMNQFNQWGFAPRNSSNGKLITFGPSARQTTPSFGAAIDIDHWTNPTTYTSTPLVYALYESTPWLRLDVTSTQMTFYIGFDGVGWVQVYTEAISTFLTTVDSVGIFAIASAGGATDLFCQVFGFVQPAL